MCASNWAGSSSRIRYDRLAGAPPSSLRWWTYRTGVRGRSAIGGTIVVRADADERPAHQRLRHGRRGRADGLDAPHGTAPARPRLPDARRPAALRRRGRALDQAQRPLARGRPRGGRGARPALAPVRLLPVELRRRARPVVPCRRRRPALQPARELLLVHRAAAPRAPPADVLDPPGPVGDDGPCRLLPRLRALADRLRRVPVPPRVPVAPARHDRDALAAEAARLRAVTPRARRAVALARTADAGAPPARPLPGAPDPARGRHGALPAGAARGGARPARAAAERAGCLLLRLGPGGAAQGPAPAPARPRAPRPAPVPVARRGRVSAGRVREPVARTDLGRPHARGRVPRGRRLRRPDPRGRADEDRAGGDRERRAVRRVRPRRRHRRRAPHGDRLPGAVRRRRGPRPRARPPPARRRPARPPRPA